MAGGSVVVRDASTEYRPSTAVTLFADLSFFCLQKLPTRSQLIRDIQANGGRVVKDEKLADYIIADHARKDAPPGSYSWTLVTTAIAHGALPDPAEHYAGPRPGSIRDLGSAIPGKTTRTPFTHEEDKQLWQWVEQEKSRGGTVKGNDIYKRLEQVNPRHTFQSWRDRYLKKLMANPPTGMEPAVLASAAPSPPTALDRDNEEEQETGPPAKLDEPERPEYDTPRRKAPVIEISSTSIPSSPVSDFEGRTYDWRVNRPLRTQEIDTAEAQLADLSMPLPLDTDDEEGDEDAGHERAAHDLVHTIEQHASSQAIRADSPTPVLETDDDAVQLKSWMATMQVRGHDESAIIQAAKCTSLQLELAELVLMHIRGGKGVPNDVPGVWTEYEDEQLEGGNARAIRLLENKHGWDACRTRLDYLEKYRDAA
ncbi:hypothetical protein CERZMDRAFT_44672 [Cercospora zeae-maydis SCOH1-5]|uniref:DNA-binding protein RAP1 n=1 Tax=Cercospora zeae-maydis SCOH1-5 TaxID=717836 RepID=A0A6A6FBZ4_9PEZI|nr:hypothetical protein CERZMDRAFT_44672 [Cercospora zeae-maydis SCOH1-5]